MASTKYKIGEYVLLKKSMWNMHPGVYTVVGCTACSRRKCNRLKFINTAKTESLCGLVWNFVQVKKISKSEADNYRIIQDY